LQFLKEHSDELFSRGITMMAVPSSPDPKMTHAVSGRTICLWQPMRSTRVNVFDSSMVSLEFGSRLHSEACTPYVGVLVAPGFGLLLRSLKVF